MADDLPARGESVRWNGRTWRIEHLDDGSVGLRDAVSGARETLRLHEWLSGLQTKLIERRVRPRVLGNGRPHRGAFMRWNNATWRVSVIRNAILNLVNVDTDEVTGLSVADFNQGCFEGTIEMTSTKDGHIDARTRQILSVPIASLSGAMRKDADTLAIFVEAWRNPSAFYATHHPDIPEKERCTGSSLSKARVQPFLQLVAAANLLVAPSFSGFYKRLAKISEAGNDVRAGISRHDLKGPHARYMSARVVQMLNDAIDSDWLTRDGKKLKVWRKLSHQIDNWNAENPDRILVCPSVGHVARYIRDEVDQYVAKRRREGKEAADRAIRQTGAGVETTEILERVEADHTLVKIRVKYRGYARIPVADSKPGPLQPHAPRRAP